MTRRTFALLGAALLASTTHAAEPGEKRTGTIEVSITYTGQGGWTKGAESGRHVLERKLTYRVPLVGHYGPASGFKEWDKDLEPRRTAPIPQPKASRADLAAILAAAEAAEAQCGEDDEACIARVINGDARAVDAAGRVEAPKTLPPAAGVPDFTRFIQFGPDCEKATATATIADRHEAVRIEGSEGGAGLNRQAYTVAGTEARRGQATSQACRVSAAIDTRTRRYALSLPIEASVMAKPSNAPGAPFAHQLTNTNGSTSLAARTRWLDLSVPAGAKAMSGRRVLENVNEAGANGTPIRATVDWTLTLD